MMDLNIPDESGEYKQNTSQQNTREDSRVHSNQNDVEGYIRDELINGDPKVVLRRIAERSEKGWKLISGMFQEKLDECASDFVALKRLAFLLGIDRTDWFCPTCNNKNYWFRKHCNMNKCRELKPDDIFEVQRRGLNTRGGMGFAEPGPARDQMGMRGIDWPQRGKRPFPDNGYGGGYNKRFRAEFHTDVEEDWPDARRNQFRPEMEDWGGEMRRNFRPERNNRRGEMRNTYIPGTEWICARCGNLNYAMRTECNMRSCNEKRPDLKAGGGGDLPEKWECPKCKTMNFPRKKICGKRGCRYPNPKMITKGEWICPRCSHVNFGQRVECHGDDCNEPRPAPKNGDWICPACQNLNYSTREFCNMRNCDTRRP